LVSSSRLVRLFLRTANWHPDAGSLFAESQNVTFCRDFVLHRTHDGLGHTQKVVRSNPIRLGLGGPNCEATPDALQDHAPQ